MTTTASPSSKQMLGNRVSELTAPDVLADILRPWSSANGKARWDSNIIQLDSTGAATVRLDDGGGTVLFAKLYPDGSGKSIYDKLLMMRSQGFGADARYQAVEPVAFVPEYDMLLARAAPGTAVSEFIGKDDAELEHGVRESARWLATMHSSPLQIGRPHTLLVSGELLSLARRLAKTVLDRPEHNPLAQKMIKQLEDLSERTNEGILVQSHGQYRPIHVFVSPSAVTVIDLDRSRPCDPSRDVAEFVHRLRMTMFSRSLPGARSDTLTQAFLESYVDVARDPRFLANLRFHWARYVFHSLNRKMKDGKDDQRDGLAEFYLAEFDDAITGRLVAPFERFDDNG